MAKSVSSALVCYPLRLHPNEDLQQSLLDFVKKHNLQSAFVVSCCGSVKGATLRMAKKPGGNEIKTFKEYFEIVALSGTLSAGEGHLHVSLGDKDGRVIGGHVMGDMPIFTTAEVVIGEMPAVQFTRPFDPETGYPELQCVQKQD